MNNITRKPIFWAIFAALSLTCAGLSYKYFSKAVPLANLTITMDRQQALTKSGQLAQQYKLGPDDYRVATTFQSDPLTQTYVELETGGNTAFNQMLEDKIYSPYTWAVRHFKEFEHQQTIFRFTPDGTPYGFKETLSENTAGAALSAEQAKIIAQEQATKQWHVKLNEFNFIESSLAEKPSKRVDHTFVYERPDKKIGQALYRLRLVVSGDKLTEVTYFMKIPQEFILRYQEMRSYNNSLAFGASMLMFLLYILGCSGIAMFLFVNKDWLIWRTAIKISIFLAALQSALIINQLPLMWISYDTALGTNVFLARILLGAVFSFLGTALFYSFIIAAAENLTRAAFNNQIQLWSVWSTDNASSVQVFGRTLGGYLLMPFHLFYVISFYFFTSTYLGWWNPSAALTDPNILATYMPWFTSIVRSLNAGFFEECLFRAIPLATAALIGRKINKEKTCIAIAFVLQALIFAAAHADYPMQPFYARLVELIFPSIMFGAIYLLFGLLPGIISHFIYDTVLIALPLFISTGPNMWINQAIVIVLAAVPLFIVLVSRLRYGSWHELAQKFYNKAWKPQPVTKKVQQEYVIPENNGKIHPYLLKFGFVVGIIGCIGWFFTTPLKQDGQALNMRRATALQQTKKVLEQQKINVKSTWQELTKLRATYKGVPGTDIQHRYVWDIGGKKLYAKLLNSYLLPAAWLMRTVTFEGSVSDRAEEYQHIFTDDSLLVRTVHKLPEDRPGKQLTEEQARVIALERIRQKFDFDSTQVKEISAVSEQRPQRRDWTFTFADITTPKPNAFASDDQLRIGVIINGEEIVDTFRHIHVPEDWARTERNNQMMTQIILSICKLILGLFLAVCMIFAMRTKKTGIPAALTSQIFLGLFGMYVIRAFNFLPSMLSNFNTSEPFINQLLVICGGLFLSILFTCSIISYLLACVLTWYPTKPTYNLPRLIFGYSVGFFVASFFAILDYFEPSIEPLWASITQLNTYSPLVDTIINTLNNFIIATIFVYVLMIIFDWLSHHWTQRKALTYIASIGIGICLVPLPLVTYIPYWLFSGTLVGLSLIVLYQFIIRFDYGLIPLITGSLFITKQLQQIMFNAYPGAVVINIYAIGVLLVFSWAWYRMMTRQTKT